MSSKSSQSVPSKPSRGKKSVPPAPARSLRERVLTKETTRRAESLPEETVPSVSPTTTATKTAPIETVCATMTATEEATKTNSSTKKPDGTSTPNAKAYGMLLPADTLELVDRMLEAVDVPRPSTPTSVADDSDASASIVSSILGEAERRVSVLYTTPKRGSRIEIDAASKVANDQLLKGKEALEMAGNMKRECKATALNSLHFLYETVLSLSESRMRHKNNLERERTRHAMELVRVERAHTKELSGMWAKVTGEMSLAREEVATTLEEVRAVRLWLGFETQKPFRGIEEVGRAIGDLDRSIQQAAGALEGGREGDAKWDSIASEISKVGRRITDVSNQIDALRRTVDALEEKSSPQLPRDGPSPSVTSDGATNTNTIRAEEMARDLTEILNAVREMSCATPASPLPTPSPISQTPIDLTQHLKPLEERLEILSSELRVWRDMPQERYQPTVPSLETEFAMEEMKQTLATINKGVTELTSMERPQSVFPSPPTGQVVGAHVPSYKEVLMRPRFPIMVESSDPLHSSSDVLQSLKERVDVVQLGIGVSGLRKVRNQKVVVNCETEGDRHTLREAIENSTDKLTVTQPSVRMPLLRLIGVANDLNNVRLEEALLSQNRRLLPTPMTEKPIVKVLRRSRARDNSRSNVVLELSPILWSSLRDREVRIGYQTVRAVDQSPVVQCYQCLSFGHIARDCKQGPRCGFCSGDHDTRECQNRNSTPRCVNCAQAAQAVEGAHPAYASECPEWRKWDRLARTMTSYC